MAITPQYAATPKIGARTLTTQDTSYTAPSAAAVITGAATGTRVSKLGVKGLATTTACLVRWFLYDNATFTLITETEVTPITASAIVKTFEETINEVTRPDLLPIILPNSTWSIHATVSATQTGLRVRAEGADL